MQHITLLVPRICRRLLDFWKIGALDIGFVSQHTCQYARHVIMVQDLPLWRLQTLYEDATLHSTDEGSDHHKASI